jgi:hypothetical protein
MFEHFQSLLDARFPGAARQRSGDKLHGIEREMYATPTDVVERTKQAVIYKAPKRPSVAFCRYGSLPQLFVAPRVVSIVALTQ